MRDRYESACDCEYGGRNMMGFSNSAGRLIDIDEDDDEDWVMLEVVVLDSYAIYSVLDKMVKGTKNI